MVKRKFGKSIITISKEGYETEQFDLEKSVSGMTFGNIIFGGIIGAGVDVATGKATNYQDSVHVKLRPIGSNVESRSNAPPDPGNLPYRQNLNQSSLEARNTSSRVSKTKSDEAKEKLLRLYIEGDITKAEYEKMMKSFSSTDN